MCDMFSEFTGWLVSNKEWITVILGVIGAFGVIVTIIIAMRQFKRQQQTLIHQNFESSFFQLLNTHNNIVETLRIERKGVVKEGRQVFPIICLDFSVIYSKCHSEKPFEHDFLGTTYSIRCSERLFELEDHTWENLSGDWQVSDEGKQAMLEYINAVYEHKQGFGGVYMPIIGHYFGSLYNVVSRVDESHLKKEEKERYINIVRRQLSRDEVVLLFYNCLTKREKDFKRLINKYALLESMKVESLPDENKESLPDPEHKVLYEKSAYGK